MAFLDLDVGRAIARRRCWTDASSDASTLAALDLAALRLPSRPRRGAWGPRSPSALTSFARQVPLPFRLLLPRLHGPGSRRASRPRRACCAVSRSRAAPEAFLEGDEPALISDASDWLRSACRTSIGRPASASRSGGPLSSRIRFRMAALGTITSMASNASGPLDLAIRFCVTTPSSTKRAGPGIWGCW